LRSAQRPSILPAMTTALLVVIDLAVKAAVIVPSLYPLVNPDASRFTGKAMGVRAIAYPAFTLLNGYGPGRLSGSSGLQLTYENTIQDLGMSFLGAVLGAVLAAVVIVTVLWPPADTPRSLLVWQAEPWTPS
jgi:hypothetical protein